MTTYTTHSEKYLNFEISIYSRDYAYKINSEQWQQLSDESSFDNPFFNQNWLLLALIHLQKEDNVYIVTVLKNRKLVCLFPIQISSLAGLHFFDIWQLKHCFNNTPLLSTQIDFKGLVIKLCNIFDCKWGKIHLHHPDLISNFSSKYGKQDKYQRAFIGNTSHIHKIIQSGKFNRENHRLIKKAKNNLDILFFEYSDIHKGLNDYSEIEHKGWKGRKNGSILSSESTKKFYFNLIKSDWAKKSISIFGLSSSEGVIACAIRVTSNNSIFEIKTTYNEDYYKYAPGRILEVYLLNNLSQIKNFKVDSCTSPNNILINRLWRHQITLYTTTIFSTCIIGRFIQKIYSIKRIIFR